MVLQSKDAEIKRIAAKLETAEAVLNMYFATVSYIRNKAVNFCF